MPNDSEKEERLTYYIEAHDEITALRESVNRIHILNERIRGLDSEKDKEVPDPSAGSLSGFLSDLPEVIKALRESLDDNRSRIESAIF